VSRPSEIESGLAETLVARYVDAMMRAARGERDIRRASG
jgi:hypothetical protein